MQGVRYITFIPFDNVEVFFERTRGGWSAGLRAGGVRFIGNGMSAVEALESVLKTIKAERRGQTKGRPTNRYRVAQSLLAPRRSGHKETLGRSAAALTRRGVMR
jgi:hypothetical protein